MKEPIENSDKFLDENFDKIDSVNSWADLMGYSRTVFWKRYDAVFLKSPQDTYIEKKKEVLLRCISMKKEFKNRELAHKIHLNDGNSLYQFVRYHLKTTPSKLKKNGKQR